MFLGHKFHVPHLYQFIRCAENLKLSNRAFVGFWVENVYLSFIPPSGFKLGIWHNDLHEQVSSMAAACRELSPLLPHVDRLDLLGHSTLHRSSHTSYTQCNGRALLSIAVQSPHVSKKLRSAHRICTTSPHWRKRHKSFTQAPLYFLLGISTVRSRARSYKAIRHCGPVVQLAVTVIH